jgi:hypothetical protein
MIEEVTPKLGELTISREEVMSLYEFVHHISGDCYDEFGERGCRGKSLDLMRKLNVMHKLLEKLVDYPELPQGMYWTSYGELQADEVDPILLRRLASGGPGSTRPPFSILPLVRPSAQSRSQSIMTSTRHAACSSFLAALRKRSSGRSGLPPHRRWMTRSKASSMRYQA